jgi:outer membrane protein assembly factor BamB
LFLAFLSDSPDGTTAPQRQVFALGPFASFDAIALDASSDMYVLAHNNPNNGNPHVVHTLKLGPTGNAIWIGSFTPGIFWGTRGGIVVTGSGVYTAAGNKLTKRDLATGTVLWEKDLTMSNGGSPLATDVDGNIFVVPFQGGVTKYNPAGTMLSVFSSVSNLASDMDVDGAGNIYIVGSTVSSKSGSDMFTQKYNSSGALLWSTTYGKTGQYSGQGIALMVRDGYVYVGGSRYNKNLDMCTLRYRAGN